MDLYRGRQEPRGADRAQSHHQNPLESLHDRGARGDQGPRRSRGRETLMTKPSWDFDLVNLHGKQEVTDEDRAYRGSRYADVRQALYENPYREGASGQVPGPLPMFESTIANAWRGAFGHGPDLMRQAS